MSENREKLHLVPPRFRARIVREDFITEGTQGELFPVRRPGMVIFVRFPDVTEQEFREIVEFAEPSYVVELRTSPRFDIGGLNRRTVFQAFEKKRIIYLDLTSSSVGTVDAEALLRNLADFLNASRPTFDRPIVFLTTQSEDARGISQRVLDVCLEFGLKPDSVYEVPRFTASMQESACSKTIA